MVDGSNRKRERETDTGPEADVSRSASGDEPVKLVHLASPSGKHKLIECVLPPHDDRPFRFHNYGEYDAHYMQFHMHTCLECRRNFPSDRYLQLHIAEQHDPLNDVKKARGEKIYACFVDGCEKDCLTWQKRKSHCIDKHMFPQDYDFFIVNDGIGARKSMLRRRPRLSNPMRMVNAKPDAGSDSQDAAVGSVVSDDGSQHSASTEPGPPVTYKDEQGSRDVDRLVSSMSALSFVPHSVRFGRGRGKGGFSKR